MDYPGNNTMELNMATVTQMVERMLNEGRIAFSNKRIRVTNVKASRGGYVDTLSVDFTTDPDPEKVAQRAADKRAEALVQAAEQYVAAWKDGDHEKLGGYFADIFRDALNPEPAQGKGSTTTPEAPTQHSP